MSQDPILEAAIDYADRGWHVVPLRPKGKIPWLKEWQVKATADSDQVVDWWNGRPESNVGVQLGPRSGLIDIEGDEEGSETEILALFGGKIPHCPTFSSARSIHRIFQWHERLPGGAVVHIGAAEIRTGNNAKGAQSVFPPSWHESGVQYTWLEGHTPDDVDPPELPAIVLARIHNLAGEDTAVAPVEHGPSAWADLYDDGGVCEGGRDNALLSEACKHAARIPNIDDAQEQAQLYTMIASMNQARCKPPLDEKDVQRLHRQAIAYTKGDSRQEAKSVAGHTETGLQHESGLWLPGDWSLQIINSDPPEYRLHVPAWAELTTDGRGVIQFSVDEFRDASKVASKVMAATRSIVLDDTPRKWPGIWNGQPGSKKENRKPSRGLFAQLIDSAELIEAPESEKHYVTVAEIFQEIVLDRAKVPVGEDTPRPNGVTQREDGTIWFRWRYIWSEPLRDKLVTSVDPPELRRRLGIAKSDFALFPPTEPKRKRYCVLRPEHVYRLMSILDGGQRSKSNTVSGTRSTIHYTE